MCLYNLHKLYQSNISFNIFQHNQNTSLQAHNFQPSKKKHCPKRTAEIYHFSCVIGHMASCFYFVLDFLACTSALLVLGFFHHLCHWYHSLQLSSAIPKTIWQVFEDLVNLLLEHPLLLGQVQIVV